MVSQYLDICIFNICELTDSLCQDNRKKESRERRVGRREGDRGGEGGGGGGGREGEEERKKESGCLLFL